MYEFRFPLGEELSQGDVIANYPFLNARNAKLIQAVENDKVTYASQRDVAESSLIPMETRSIMLVSQNCDIDNRENILVCPVYKLEEFIASNNPNQDRLRDLRSNKLYYWFYLPTYEGRIEESFVDFTQISSVERGIIQSYSQNVILSVNDLGRHKIGWSLANMFARPN